MSVVTFTQNVQITARSAFEVSQAIAYNAYTAGVIVRDNAIRLWDGTASHRRTVAVIARATYAGVIAAAPHVRAACIQLIAVTIALAVLAYQRGAQFRGWLDALVAECEAPAAPAVPEIEPEPEPVATPPAPSAPVATPPEPVALAALSATELRRMARDAGMPRAARATKAAAIAWLTA